MTDQPEDVAAGDGGDAPTPAPDGASEAEAPEPTAASTSQAPPRPAAPAPVSLAAPASAGSAGAAAARAPAGLPAGPGGGLPSGPGHRGPGAPSLASRRSPYDHVLRVRGDVGSTGAIAVFLGGLTAVLAVWGLLTAGGPEVYTGKGVVGEDGKLALPVPLGPKVHAWVDGHEPVTDPAHALVEGEYRYVPGSPAGFEVGPGAAGQELAWGYDLGREPVVSSFLLPKPGDVLGALVELSTGAAFQARCPNRECTRREPVPLSAGEGEALEAFRMRAMGETSAPPPDVKCPACGTSLAGEIAIALSPHNFRAGLEGTLWRTTIGFLIAAAVCVPLGVLSGAFPPIKRFVAPLEIAGGYAPPVALLPLAAALSGVLANNQVPPQVGENVARIAFLFVVIAFWLYPLVVKEIEAVDETYINTAYCLGATRGQVVLQVLVPIAKSKIWEHLRVTYAIGWASIILAEGYASSKVPGDYGIGFFMVEMQRRHFMVNYFAAVIVIIAAGISIDWLFRLAGRKLFPYEVTQ